MSLTGWLDQANRTFEGFVDLPLPEEHLRVMYEGGEGDIAVQIQHVFGDLRVLFDASALNEQVGFAENAERVYRFSFIQPYVFGVLLLDSFTPPNIKYETVNPTVFPIDACSVNPVLGSPVEYNQPSAVETVYESLTGSEVEYEPQ